MKLFFPLIRFASNAALGFNKLILVSALMLFPFFSNATHIAGGDLDVQWISGNNFKVTLKLFRDCANGGAAFDQTVDMAVYENGTDNLINTFSMSLGSVQNLVLGDACFAPPSSICMQQGGYETTITLSNNTNGYYVIWERCCRSPLNLNIDPDQAMMFYANVPNPSLQNSSPKFGDYPLNGYFCVNTRNAFDFSATDVDGDVLVYSLVTPLSGALTGSSGNPGPVIQNYPSFYPQPLNTVIWNSPYNLNNIVGGTSNMSINSSTGILTCQPTTTGAFTFAVKVEEFRAGVKIGEVIRDVQFFALQCDKQVAAITQTPNNDNIALEGCIKASFTFTLDQTQATDKIIDLDIKGTAINGVDYARLDPQIIIPAGQTEGTIIIDAFADGITEGTESVYLIFYPIPCNNLVTDTISLFINDDQPLSFNLTGTDLSCNGNGSGQIDATISGGAGPYNITVTDTLTGDSTIYSSTNLPITGLDASTYLIKISDSYGCGGQAEVVGALFNAGQTFLPDGNGQIFTSTLNISGISQANIISIDEIQSICLNIEHSSLGDVAIRLVAPDGSILVLKQRFNGSDGSHTDLGEPVAKNQTDGGNSDITPGIGYDYCFTSNPLYGTMVAEQLTFSHTYTDATGRVLTDNYLPSGSYTPYESLSNLIGAPINGNWAIEVEDYRPQSNGYIFNWSISFKIDKDGDIITIAEPPAINITGGVSAASCNGSDGAIDISVSGVNTPFTYAWSNSAITEDISGLAAGTYSVIVTDTNSCTNTATYLVPNATGPGISAVVTDQSCPGLNNGSIDATFTGTITNISWSGGQSTEDISGLAPGVYTVSVTDNNGCISLQSFTVNPAAPISISGMAVNEICGNKDGAIDITVSGGAGAYTYSWSNGPSTEDIADLQQGTYTVTVTDTNSCSAQNNFTLINEVGNCVPPCDLAIINEAVVEETCGQGNGSISISVYTSNSPSLISWSNGSTSNTLTNLNAGTYTVTVSDALGCQVIKTYTIANDAGTLAITNPLITDDICGTNNGAIDVNVSGGTAGYAYSWSNGSITEDISGIGQGSYTLTVTDGASCIVSATYTLANQTGAMSIVSQNVVDEQCGDGNGSVSLTLSPGTYTYNWSNGATTQNISNLSAGTYSVTITQTSNGCKLYSPDYTVTNGAGTLTVSLFDKDDEICGNGTGDIDITVSGGTSYTFNWSNGASTEDLSGLSAGTYSAIITDAAGCSVSTGDIIIFNTQGTLDVTVFKTDEACGNGLGSISLNISGGSPSYNVLWSNSAITPAISNLSSGTYDYTVSDQNGCTASSSVFIANTAGTLNIDSLVTVDEQCGNSLGQASVYVSGGTGAGTYSYSWNTTPVQITSSITGLSAGTYTVTIQDGNTCTTTAVANITNGSGTMVLTNEVIVNSECGQSIGSIDISITGGTGTYTYLWSNGAITEDLVNVFPGNYTCVISDQSGCTLNYAGTVGNDPGPVVSNVGVINEFCSSMDGAIYLTVSGGVGPYTYSWDDGEITEDISNLPGGTYTCIITDTKNCQTSVTATVTNSGPFFISDTLITDASCATCSDGSIDITITNGFGLNYFWDNGEQTEDIYNLLPGTYTVYYDNGWCQMQSTFVVGFGTGTGITNASGNLDFSVSPNPSTGVFHIGFKNANSEKTIIEVSDMLGQIVKREELAGNVKDQLSFDLNSLKNGMYYIHLIQGDKRSTKKIVLSK